MADLTSKRIDAVNAHIETALAATEQATAAAGQHASMVMDQLRAFTQGGKRLRALLLLACHHAHGSANSDAALSIAAAIELFQVAALIHDDVIDGSDTRRGNPSAHRSLERLHGAQRLRGDSAQFGVAGAILAGDVALMAAHRALATATAAIPDDGAATVATLFGDMAALVTMGQFLDLRIAAEPLAGLEYQEREILATMRCKTASYTAELPLALGAAVAGAHRDRVTALRAVGLPLGLAFQLRDDVLGLTGASAVTGKPAGDDVREGKRTLIMWRAWCASTPAQRNEMTTALGNPDASDAQVEGVINIATATGALRAAEADIDRYGGEAHRLLTELGLSADAALTQLFDQLTARSA